MFFEFVVLGIIPLAVFYWAMMFVIGRRGDVLHGNFVQQEPAVEPAEVTPRPGTEKFQALLTVIKQDLNDAAQV